MLNRRGFIGRAASAVGGMVGLGTAAASDGTLRIIQGNGEKEWTPSECKYITECSDIEPGDYTVTDWYGQIHVRIAEPAQDLNFSFGFAEPGPPDMKYFMLQSGRHKEIAEATEPSVTKQPGNFAD